MVVRQEYANKEFMTGYLSFIDRFRPKALAKIETISDDIHRRRLILDIFSDGLDGIIASYTLGHDISDIAQRFNVFLEDLRRYFEEGLSLANDGILEQYINCLWMLSLCYFFNASKADVMTIAERNPFTGKDWLIDRLIAAATQEYKEISNELVFPDVYKPLKDSIPLTLSQKDRDNLVTAFLSHYYESLKGKDVTWYDSHKEREAQFYRHIGYWQFELAALITDVGLDDSGFRDHPLYPRDLVDWKRAHISI